MEAKALALDERVRTVNYCLLASGEGQVRIVNTKGLDLTHSLNAAYAYVSVVVGEGGDTKTFGNFETIGDFSQFDPEKLARGAVEEAVALLGASPVESGEYPVILRWEAAATLLGTFAGIFSAENVRRTSLLKGKLGSRRRRHHYHCGRSLLPRGSTLRPLTPRSRHQDQGGGGSRRAHDLSAQPETAARTACSPQAMPPRARISPAWVAPSICIFNPVLSAWRIWLLVSSEGWSSSISGHPFRGQPRFGRFSLGAFGYLVEKGKIVRQ